MQCSPLHIRQVCNLQFHQAGFRSVAREGHFDENVNAKIHAARRDPGSERSGSRSTSPCHTRSLYRIACRSVAVQVRNLIKYSTGESIPTFSGSLRLYQNGDQTAWIGGSGMLAIVLCGQEPWFNPVATGLPSRGDDPEALAAVTWMYAELSRRISMVASAAAEVRGDNGVGKARKTEVELPWAYGVERYEVSSDRTPEGHERIRLWKLGTIHSTPSAGGGPTEVTSAEKKAREPSLESNGTWHELAIIPGERPYRLPPGMSFQDWRSASGSGFRTVSAARKAGHGCGLRSGR